MIKKYRDLFPAWCSDTETKYDLILSDDMDSLVSCCLLNKLFKFEINYFYSFDTLYMIKKSDNPAIGVDIDFISGNCWSNHVTMLNPKDRVNKNSANLNNIDRINRNNYFTKYCGSTLLQIWSYYNQPLPSTTLGKMILLAIDYSHKGFYSKWPLPQQAHQKYICNIMEFQELIEIEGKHTEQDFDDVNDSYKLYKKIHIDENGILQTELPLDKIQEVFDFEIKLPDAKFKTVHEFEPKQLAMYKHKTYSNRDFDNLVSIALTNKNYSKYTTKG